MKPTWHEAIAAAARIALFMRWAGWLIIPAMIGGAVGLVMSIIFAPADLRLPGAGLPISRAQTDITPQQRIDEAFDALGMQRAPVPPGWIEDVKR